MHGDVVCFFLITEDWSHWLQLPESWVEFICETKRVLFFCFLYGNI